MTYKSGTYIWVPWDPPALPLVLLSLLLHSYMASVYIFSWPIAKNLRGVPPLGADLPPGKHRSFSSPLFDPSFPHRPIDIVYHLPTITPWTYHVVYASLLSATAGRAGSSDIFFQGFPPRSRSNPRTDTVCFRLISSTNHPLSLPMASVVFLFPSVGWAGRSGNFFQGYPLGGGATPWVNAVVVFPPPIGAPLLVILPTLIPDTFPYPSPFSHLSPTPLGSPDLLLPLSPDPSLFPDTLQSLPPDLPRPPASLPLLSPVLYFGPVRMSPIFTRVGLYVTHPPPTFLPGISSVYPSVYYLVCLPIWILSGPSFLRPYVLRRVSYLTWVPPDSPLLVMSVLPLTLPLSLHNNSPLLS